MTYIKGKILLVDDDVDILEFIKYNLVKEGFDVETCTRGKEALEMVNSYTPQLILLDVMMPEMDGIELCESLRGLPKLDSTIIAFLTARGEDFSQIAGFDAGADDYISKPIKPKLLVSRVKALLKRNGNTNNEFMSTKGILEFDNFIIDQNKYALLINGLEKKLPKKEFEILYLLASKEGNIFSRDQIYQSVWGSGVIVVDRTIDVHIRKLRESIGSDRIQTIKGVGYMFKQ